jgi:endonuclease YncB( thermonuclease family)
MIQRTIRMLLVAAVTLGSFTVASREAHAESNPRQIGPCLALRVVDGDTADLQCGRRVLGVRLRNVAAPRPGESGYAEATRALRELLRERALYVVPEVPGELPVDPNGRAVGYLVDRSGANLNVVMVLLGWATYSEDGGPSHLEHSFRLAEADARADRRALWATWSIAAGGSQP